MVNWNPSSKHEIEDSIFTVMSRLAFQHGAVNLGQGYPDADGPDWVKEAACKAVMEKPNQYANMAGILSLRQAVSKKHQTLYDLSYDVDTEITITNGASEAIYLALSTMCGPGDEVVIFEPAYDIYAPIIRWAGGTPVGVPLLPPDYSFSSDQLEAALSDKTRIILLNSPHNPTGRVFSGSDMQVIRRICIKHDLIAITDEVYEHLIFQGEHIPLASLEGMRERTITISSTAKTFSMTGWKIGYILAPPEPTDLIRKLHQLVCFCVAKPLQHGMSVGVESWQNAVEPLMEKLSENRRLLIDGLKDCGFRVTEPNGTFFLLADYQDHSKIVDTEFAIQLIKHPKGGVATIPISVFYLEPGKAPQTTLRFCFAKERLTLETGLARLKEILI